MNRNIALSIAVAFLSLGAGAQGPAAGWIDASNKFTNQLLAVEMKHAPELTLGATLKAAPGTAETDRGHGSGILVRKVELTREEDFTFPKWIF